MSSTDEFKDLLIEIRDNQRLSLKRQAEHLDIAQQQLKRSNTQIAESIELQKQGIRRFKAVSLIAVPGIIICIALIIYLMVSYL